MLQTTSHVPELQFTFEPGAARPLQAIERAIDEAIAESFPASDPPAWNPGLARPIPAEIARNQAGGARPSPRVETAVARGPWLIDVSRPHKTKRTAGDVFVSVAAVVGLALLAPLAVLTVGTPIAFTVRGLLELILWMFGVQG